jgi:transcriptional regulator with XRE-family HTH domain
MGSTDSLGKRLRDVRERMVLTQAELAALLGVPERTLQAYEAGALTPRPKRHRELLAWLAEAEEGAAA